LFDRRWRDNALAGVNFCSWMHWCRQQLLVTSPDNEPRSCSHQDCRIRPDDISAQRLTRGTGVAVEDQIEI
jgi:hypothetical protein